jgi:AsmA protein
MRHWGIATGAVLGAAFGLSLGLVNWPIDQGHVRRDLLASLGPADAPSVATLTLLPRPTLRLKNLRFSTADGALKARAAEAEVTLRLNRLLVGEFEPRGLVLRGADLDIDLDAAEAALKTLHRPPVARLIVEGGGLTIDSSRHGLHSHFDIASARVEWPTPGSALRAAVTGRWRSQPVEATAELDAPLAASHGETTTLRVALDAPLAQWRLAGEWSPRGGADGAFYRGQVSALIPSLDRFAHWIDRPAPGPTPAGMELTARASLGAQQMKLSDATLTLGGQRFEGDLDVSKTQAGVAVSGTLAADALDLEPLIGPPPTLLDEAGEWSKAPALPAPSPELDLDLRISATRALWRGHALDDAAAAVSQRNGRLSVRLLEAGFAHGSLSGEISVENQQGSCQGKLSLSLENADLGALLADFGESNFTGQGGLKLSIAAHGRSPAEIVASADGEASLEIADGALRNLNFEEALRRGQRRLIDMARDMNAGATRFGAAGGRVEISQGEARFVDVGTQAPGVSLALSGGVDLVGRVWRAQVSARQSSDDGKPAPDGAHLDFSLSGPWSGPVLAPLPPAD